MLCNYYWSVSIHNMYYIYYTMLGLTGNDVGGMYELYYNIFCPVVFSDDS